MKKTAYDVYRYSDIVVLVFGILGNILVVTSILRQKIVMKNNYYYLVLQLAICDLGVLVIYLVDRIASYWYEEALFYYSLTSCVFSNTYYVFQVAGIGMMLIISVLRYRATVHPLKPAISRRKLKVVCGLAYTVGLTAGYGTRLPLCFMRGNDIEIVYFKYFNGYLISCFYIFPTIFMAVLYYKIGRAVIKQTKYIKSMCSNQMRRSAPNPSFNILRYIRNRRTFFVCLITVLCYGVGNIPMSVYVILSIAGEYHLLMKYDWLRYFAFVLRVCGSHSVNPLIYGILDKKLLTFWRFCRKKKPKTQENQKQVGKWDIFIDVQPRR